MSAFESQCLKAFDEFASIQEFQKNIEIVDSDINKLYHGFYGVMDKAAAPEAITNPGYFASLYFESLSINLDKPSCGAGKYREVFKQKCQIKQKMVASIQKAKEDTPTLWR